MRPSTSPSPTGTLLPSRPPNLTPPGGQKLGGRVSPQDHEWDSEQAAPLRSHCSQANKDATRLARPPAVASLSLEEQSSQTAGMRAPVTPRPQQHLHPNQSRLLPAAPTPPHLEPRACSLHSPPLVRCDLHRELDFLPTPLFPQTPNLDSLPELLGAHQFSDAFASPPPHGPPG